MAAALKPHRNRITKRIRILDPKPTGAAETATPMLLAEVDPAPETAVIVAQAVPTRCEINRCFDQSATAESEVIGRAVSSDGRPDHAVRARRANGFYYHFPSVLEHVAALRINPLGQLDHDLSDCGLEPMLSLAKLVYLVTASSYLTCPVSIQVRGESERGKSTLVAKVCELHPERDIISLNSFTWAALLEGLGRGGDLRKNVLVLDENVEARRRDPELLAALRELTTKEQVTRCKIVSGVPQTITLRGPVTVVDCMLTDTQLSDQDTNRYLVVVTPDDEHTLCAISALNEERFEPAGTARNEVAALIADGHRRFLTHLRKDLRVFKPPGLHGTARSPRFDSIVFSLTCAAAWLEQACEEVGPQSSLTARPCHYEYVWKLLREVRVLSPRSGLSGSARFLLTSWQALAGKRGNIPLVTSELHNELAPTRDPGDFSRLLKELRELGLAEVVDRRSRGQHVLQLTGFGLNYAGCDLVAALPHPEGVTGAQGGAEPRSAQATPAEPIATVLPRNQEECP